MAPARSLASARLRNLHPAAANSEHSLDDLALPSSSLPGRDPDPPERLPCPCAEFSAHPPPWFPPAQPHGWGAARSPHLGVGRHRSLFVLRFANLFPDLLRRPSFGVDHHLLVHPHENVMRQDCFFYLGRNRIQVSLLFVLRLEVKHGEQEVANLLCG